jgi:hypothetical protein
VNQNISVIAQEMNNSILGYFSVDSVLSRDTSQCRVRISLTVSDSVTSVVCTRNVIVRNDNVAKNFSITFNDPDNYAGIYSNDSTPVLRFIDSGTICTPSGRQYCINALLPVPYVLREDNSFVTDTHTIVRLQIINESSNELIFEKQQQALPRYLFGKPGGNFLPDSGVWFKIDDTDGKKIYLTAKNGDYIVSLISRSLTVDRSLSSSGMVIHTDGVNDSLFNAPDNQVFRNLSEGTIVWQVNTGDTLKRLTLEVMDNNDEMLYLNVQKKVDDSLYAAYFNPVMQIENGGRGIFFTGDSCESIGALGAVNLGVLGSRFSWDGLVHVGNSYTYIPQQGSYRIILEAFGSDNKQYCSSQKSVLVETAALKLDGPYINNDTIFVLPGLSTSSQLSLGVNKSAYITVTVIDPATSEEIIKLAENRLWNPGAKKFTVSWNGYIGDRLADVKKQYAFSIHAVAADSIGIVDIIPSARIRVMISDKITMKDSSEFMLDGTTYERFSGKDSVPFNTGTSKFQFLASAAGRFTPEVPVTIPVEFNGKQEVTAYPTENFAIGIRRSFDAVKLGYIIYAKSYDAVVTGEPGRWESWAGDHTYRFDKLYGVIEIHKNDSLNNKIFKQINAPDISYAKNKNDALYLKEYKVAFFLLGKDGRSLGRWDGGNTIRFKKSDGTDSSSSAATGTDPTYREYDQFRSIAEAAGAVDVFTVSSNEMASGPYYNSDYYGDTDARHLTNWTNNSTWAVTNSKPMWEYRTRSEGDDFARFYELWADTSITQYRTYINAVGIASVMYNRDTADYPRYTTPTFGLPRTEQIDTLFVVDSSSSYNPVRGCVRFAHRECARQVKHIKWYKDLFSSWNRYGYGYPVIELSVNLYSDVWNPPFGYNNIVNRFHIWSPENLLAYSNTGYIRNDRIDNDLDGDGTTYSVGSGKVAENGSDAGDTGIPEINGYLVYGSTQKINTFALGDRGEPDSTDGMNILRFRDYYSDFPMSVPDAFGRSHSLASLNPENEFTYIKTLKNPDNYRMYRLTVKHLGTTYHKTADWFAWPGPENFNRYPQFTYYRQPKTFTFTSMDDSIVLSDSVAYDTSLACCGNNSWNPIGNASIELSLSVDSVLVPIPPLSWPLPSDYVKTGPYWIKEDEANPSHRDGPRNDNNELWVLSSPVGKPSQSKNLTSIVHWNGGSNTWTGQINLDTVNLGAGNALADYDVVLPGSSIPPSTQFVDWNDTARYARYLKSWVDSKGGANALTFNVTRTGNNLDIVPVNSTITDWNSIINDPVLKNVDDDHDSLVDEEGNIAFGIPTDADNDNVCAEDGYGVYRSPLLDYINIRTPIGISMSDNLAFGNVGNINDRKIPTPFLRNGINVVPNPSVSLTVKNYRLLNVRGQEHPDLTLTNDSMVTLKPFNKAPEKLIKITGKVRGPYEIYVSDRSKGFIKIVPQGSGKINPFTGTRATDTTFSGALGFWDVSRENGYKSVVLLEYSRDSIASSNPKNYSIVNYVYIGQPYTITDTVTLMDPYGKVKVTIPPGATSEEKVFTVTPVTPVEANVSGLLSNLGPIIEVSPNVSSFNTGSLPAIEWKITREEINLSGWSINSFKIVKVGDDGALSQITNQVITYYKLIGGIESPGTPADYDYIAVSGNVYSFSRYAIVRDTDVPSQPVTIDAVPERSLQDSITISGTRDSTKEIVITVSSTDSSRTDTIASGTVNWNAVIYLYYGHNGIKVQYSSGNTNTAEAFTNYYLQLDTPLAINVIDTVISPDRDGNHDDLLLELLPLESQLPLNGEIVLNLTNHYGGALLQKTLLLDKDSDTLRQVLNGLHVTDGDSLTVETYWVESNGFKHLPTFAKLRIDYKKPVVTYDSTCGKIVNSAMHIDGSITDESGIASVEINVYGKSKVVLYSHQILSNSDTLVHASAIFDVWNLNASDVIDNKNVNIQFIATDIAGNRTITNRMFDIFEDYSKWKHSKEITINCGSYGFSGGINGYTIPIPVCLDSSNFNFNECNIFGQDIRFLDTNGQQIPYEIEQWSTVDRKAVIWIRIPENSDSIIRFRILWGNEDAKPRQNNKLVWGDSHTAVYHGNLTGESIPVWIRNGSLLLANDGIIISDRDTLEGNIYSSENIIYGNDNIQNGNSFSSGVISVNDRTLINGTLASADTIAISSVATVSGAVTPNATVDIPLLPVPASIPFNNNNLDVQPGDSISLAPGNYGVFHAYANAIVKLRNGNYNFRKFILEPDVKIRITISPSDTVKIFAQDTVHFADRCKMILSDTSAAARVCVFSNQTADITIGTECDIVGMFAAPTALVSVGSRTHIKGTISANRIILEPDVRLYPVAQEVVASKLILHDATGHGYNGTAYGARTSTEGFFAKGFELDGTDDYITASSNDSLSFDLGTFTLSAWVKLPENETGVIFSCENDLLTWDVVVNDSSQLLLIVGSDSSYLLDTLPSSSWQQLTITYDRTKLSSYLNGIKKKELYPGSNFSVNSKGLKIGKETAGQNIAIRIDEIRLAPDAQSDQNIRFSYELEKRALLVDSTEQDTVIIPGDPDTVSSSSLFEFEDASLWHLSGVGSVNSDMLNKYSGSASLIISGGGYQEITSDPFPTSPDNPMSANLEFYLKIGTVQPNPDWVGLVQIFITCPSGGIDNYYIGQHELTSYTQDVFAAHNFTIPVSVLNILNSGIHNDISLKIVLNTNNGSGPYNLDKLRFY